MSWLIELFVLLILFTLAVIPTVLKNPLSMVHDYPTDIYEKAIELGLVKEAQNGRDERI